MKLVVILWFLSLNMWKYSIEVKLSELVTSKKAEDKKADDKDTPKRKSKVWRTNTENLQDLRSNMTIINTHMVLVKQNLEHMEKRYEGIFQKVDRLATSRLELDKRCRIQ